MFVTCQHSDSIHLDVLVFKTGTVSLLEHVFGLGSGNIPYSCLVPFE